MRECFVIGVTQLGQLGAHLGAIEAEKGVALNGGSFATFAAKYLVKGVFDRRRSGSRRSGNADDWVLFAHDLSSEKPAFAEQR